jgi:hypothetical protein
MLRIVAAIETLTPQMVENNLREIKYRLDIVRSRKGAHAEVVWQSAVMSVHTLKLLDLCFHIPSAVLFYCFLFECYRPRKTQQ